MLRSSLAAIGAAVTSATSGIETPGENTIVIDGKHYPKTQIEAIRKTMPVSSPAVLRPWEVESEEEKIRREEEENRLARDLFVYNIFKMFDTDASGGIDAKEFKDLAYLLGESLTDEEVEDCISQLDMDRNGTIEFVEFLTWWNKEDIGSFGGALDGFAAKLNLLKLRLQSRSYMRTVGRLLRRSLDASNEVGKEGISSATSSSKEEDDEFFTVDMQITSGKSEEFNRSVGIRLENRPEDSKQEYAVNAIFKVREDADEGELNTLVEKLKGYANTYLEGNMPPGVSIPDIIIDEDEEGKKVLTISAPLPEDFVMFGHIAGQVDAVVELTMDTYSKESSISINPDSPARFRILIKIPYSVAGMAGAFLGPTPVAPTRIAKLAKSITFTAEVARGKNMNKIMKEFIQGLPLPPGITLPPIPDETPGTMEEIAQNMRKMYAGQMAQGIRMIDTLPPEEKGLAEDALQTYYNLVKLLKGVVLIEGSVGPKAVAIRALGPDGPEVIPLFDIFPTEADINEAMEGGSTPAPLEC